MPSRPRRSRDALSRRLLSPGEGDALLAGQIEHLLYRFA